MEAYLYVYSNLYYVIDTTIFDVNNWNKYSVCNTELSFTTLISIL
jgi:hypothetical protein